MSLDIDLLLPALTFKKSMARQQKEKAANCLERLRLLLVPRPAQLKGVRTSREELLHLCPKVGFVALDESVPEEEVADLPNSEFWATISHLTINEVRVPVFFNIPTVTNITPPSSMMVGLPAICSEIRVMFSSVSSLCQQWCVVNGSEVTIECSNQVFIPAERHIGKKMIFRCRPASSDAVWAEVDLPSVQLAAPPQCRWVHTQKNADEGAFRVMSYNILHEDFCISKFAKSRLYPFATEEVLATSYRKLLVAREILELRPDVVCLQECGGTLFQSFLSPFFQHAGYNALYSNKNGKVHEGCTIAFRKERFTEIFHAAKPLVMETLSSQHPEFAAEISAAHPHLAEALQRVTSVGTVTVLKDSTTDRYLAVVNTHLFYHPNACHIRALQAFMLLHLAKSLSEEVLNEEQRSTLAFVVAGDFNFTRVTGGYRLVTEGVVDESNDCWEKGFKFWWECDKQTASEEEAAAATSPSTLTGPPSAALRTRLHNPFGNRLVDSHIGDTSMRWTNYAMSFKEIIDHIFFDTSQLRLLRTVPLPSEEEITAEIGIPSKVFPSDHVAIVADLEYK